MARECCGKECFPPRVTAGALGTNLCVCATSEQMRISMKRPLAVHELRGLVIGGELPVWPGQPSQRHRAMLTLGWRT